MIRVNETQQNVVIYACNTLALNTPALPASPCAAAWVGTSWLNWLLGDHPSLRSGQALGSTAITADSSGNKLAELRYKARGETRYTYGTTPMKRHTKLRFWDFDLIFTKSCISTH
jgi:hypothetical protein